MKNIFYTALFSFAMTIACIAQQVLSGVYVAPKPENAVTLFITVIDSLNNIPIDSLNVSIFGSDGTNFNLRTNKEGKIKCLLGPYNFKLTFTAEKYKSTSDDIKFDHVGDTIYLKKYLKVE